MTETFEQMEARAKNAMRGRMNRASGGYFEKIIEDSLYYYQIQGMAYIEKTPEPMKIIGKTKRKDVFMACFAKKAQPDFKGTLSGGQAIVFDAKHTDRDRILQSAVSEEQTKAMNLHEALGAAAYIIVSFGFQRYFRIPWNAWRTMKNVYGRKYIKPEDVEKYEIRNIGGTLYLLEGLEEQRYWPYR